MFYRADDEDAARNALLRRKECCQWQEDDSAGYGIRSEDTSYSGNVWTLGLSTCIRIRFSC